MGTKMKMEIHDGVVTFNSSETRDEFLDFLRKLASDDPLIKQAIIPIIENEGIIPNADISFTNLVRNLNSDIHKIPGRIFILWNQMHGQESDPDTKQVLNTKEAAYYIKREPSTVANLARAGVIPAKKVGREWRFLRSNLNTFLKKHGYPAVSHD